MECHLALSRRAHLDEGILSSWSHCSLVPSAVAVALLGFFNTQSAHTSKTYGSYRGRLPCSSSSGMLSALLD